MSSFLEYANDIARAALPKESVVYGPWRGSMRDRSQDRVPNDFIAGTNVTNFLYLPDTGYWKRRGGQLVKFDTLTSGHATAGLLPGAWGAKARWAEEYDGPMNTDGIPSLMALATRETIASGLDDGRFSNLWVRDQIGNTNYTLGSEYSATTYPSPGSPQSYKFIPLWYDSGDGGLTRGAGDAYDTTRSEFARRFFVSGSRRFIKAGTWWYNPSFLGTPSRTTINKAAVSSPGVQTATANPAPQDWGVVGFGGVAWQAIETNDGATSYIRRHGDVGAYNADFTVPSTLSPSIPSWKITYIARYNPGLAAPPAGVTLTFSVVPSDGNRFLGPSIDASLLTTSFVTYTTTIDTTGIPNTSGQTANSFRVNNVVGSLLFYDGYIEITQITIEPTTPAISASNRLIPSGPWPSTHAGTLTKGTLIASSASATSMRPSSDVSDGSWLGQDAGTSLFSYIDEAITDDTDYIECAGGGTLCEVHTSDPGFAPTSQVVTLNIRASCSSPVISETLKVEVVGNATVCATLTVVLSSTSWQYYNLVLTAAQIAAVTAQTANWSDVRLRFTATGSASAKARVAQAVITIGSGGATEGAWKGSDRFFFSVAYRFEDDSVWMPCLPRFPNDILLNGFGMFTVDSANPASFYDKVVWTIPVAPKGVKSILLLRAPKIDSTTATNLQLKPYDLRLVEEVTNGVTTYDDYFANDDNLAIDPGRSDTGRDGFFIRFDHRMPPRARHIAAGDMRICHSYGSMNPAAVEIAPIGRTVDYDLNLLDEDANLYSQSSMYVRLALDSSGVATLTLNKSDGASLTTKSLALATYNTLQKLVDAVNATFCATDSQQWRAQLCPGVDPAAVSATSLLPHFRTIDSCVVAGQTITKASGGLSKVAVGALVSGTGVTTGAYISRIDSDTQLTFVGTITAATKTLNFYFELEGYGPTAGTANSGYQRVIANSLPGFLYFNRTYLNAFPIEKSASWMTIAPPGSMKSAPNSFSNKTANVFRPPNADTGMSLGVAAVDQGFVVAYANRIAAIRNMRDQGSGLDEEYRLQMFNESRGACGPVIAGDRMCFYPSREGICAADLFNEIRLSDDIFQHAPIFGDFSYEAPLSQAAASSDTDTGYFHLRVMRGTLWVSYRASGSHPNRLVAYDFSPGRTAGLESLLRDRPLLDPETGRVVGPPGSLYGWSVPLVRSITAMVEGRRSDGAHIYGWNEENGGTGDGRIDELETTDTDNGTAIVGSVETPWEHEQHLLSAQEITVEHVAPDGSTGSLTFHRSLSDAQSSLTLTTSNALAYVRDVKMLPQSARAVTHDCFISYSQATGGARELRKLWLRLKRLPSYK